LAATKSLQIPTQRTAAVRLRCRHDVGLSRALGPFLFSHSPIQAGVEGVGTAPFPGHRCPPMPTGALARRGLSFFRSIGASASAPALFLLRCCAAAWCDQIPTLAENQLYPYSGHSNAHRHPHGCGKLFTERMSNHRKAGVVMSIIPLDLQRRCERRWAARFSRPIPSAAPRNQRPERDSLQIAAPATSKEKPAGLKRQA
jgi:hypothetical protein